MPIPFLPSTKSAFLCFFGLRNPYFRAFRAQNRGSCAFLAFGTLVFGLFEHKIEVFVLGRAFVFWEWWVLSCILTFVVCLSNFYELFLLKLPLRVCRSVLAGALLPLRTCRSVAAVTWLSLSSYRGAAVGMLSPTLECYLRCRNAISAGGILCHHRWNAADAGMLLPPPAERRHRSWWGGCFEFVIEFHIRLDYVC